MAKFRDLTGQRFGKLTAIEVAGKNKFDRYMWKFLCDCGVVKELVANYVVQGDTKSCGCSSHDNPFKTHGKSKTKEYLAWTRLKGRCNNKNSQDYKDYGATGVTVDDSFVNNFNNFLLEIGDMPTTGKWSVDRIDNSLGYVVGNIRWATDEQQARNHTKQSNNKTGVTGVHLLTKKSLVYVATWSEVIDGNYVSKSKNFPVAKHGLLPAFAKAIAFRLSKIEELNDLGYGYTENHGK